VMHHLFSASQSSVLGWLTIAFFLVASVVTYTKRIDQYKVGGGLPPETPSAPPLFSGFFWLENGLKIALLVLNWQYGLFVYIVGFVLAWLGVLEQTGRTLLRLLSPPTLPTPWVHWSLDPNSPGSMRRAIRAERIHFMSVLLLTAAAYVGLSLLLNAIRQDPRATPMYLWGLIVPQFMLYIYLFWLASTRAGECGVQVVWLAWVLAIFGRFYDWEVAAIPAVILASLILSGTAKRRKLVYQEGGSHGDEFADEFLADNPKK